MISLHVLRTLCSPGPRSPKVMLTFCTWKEHILIEDRDGLHPVPIYDPETATEENPQGNVIGLSQFDFLVGEIVKLDYSVFAFDYVGAKLAGSPNPQVIRMFPDWKNNVGTIQLVHSHGNLRLG